MKAWEVRAAESRRVKAGRLARSLRNREIGAALAAHYTVDARREAARIAGTRPPSDDTWRVVVEMLAASGRARSCCVTCGLGDPEGEPGAPKAAGHLGRCSA